MLIRADLPWAKRCVNAATSMLWEGAPDEVKEAILQGIARGDVGLPRSVTINMARGSIQMFA